MLVYRVCSKDEVDRIFKNEDFSTIGCLGEDFIKYQQTRDINNHKYDSKKLYLHFFGDIWSITYWKAYKDNYVCTYDIPNDILDNCFGIGKYLSPYSDSDNRTSLSEYAVESNKIKKEYLVRVEVITENLDFTDDDYPDTLDDYLKVIYESEPKNVQSKKKEFSDEFIKRLLKNLQGNR